MLTKFILNRLSEPSSYAGLAVIAGDVHSMAAAGAVSPMGLSILFGGLAALFAPERSGKVAP